MATGICRRQWVSEGKAAAAREMRSKPTPSERAMWELLRRKSVGGLRFRRQQSIKGFIVDFYCERARLVVEVDGGYHDAPDQRAYDAERDVVLSGLGLRLVRFSDLDVLEQPEKVVRAIREAALGQE